MPMSMSTSSQAQEILDRWATILSAKANPQIFIALATGLWLIWAFCDRFKKPRNPNSLTSLPAPGFPPITPLPEFDWRTAEPEKCRPFIGKEKFHLTMALETLDPSDLIRVDKTYKDRLSLRRSLLNQYNDVVIGVDDPFDSRIRDAVSEYYTFVLGTYLPGRYPGLFKLQHHHSTTLSAGSKTYMLENTVTDETWPINMPKETRRGLEILARVIDEDILFLLRDTETDPPTATGDPGNGKEEEKDVKYRLKAYAACFPSGFDTRQKLGLRLAAIHSPVPGYREKLERSMDRFFARLEVGKFVKRVNWSVTTDAQLFAAFGGVHGQEGDGLRGLRLEDLDLNSTVLRCERQTLHRLPKSKALVFAFHTYTYPIQEVKDEGLGKELAKAIDGLKEGSVPQMHAYKRGTVWGEAVKEYLS